jgi:hypothetical protein
MTAADFLFVGDAGSQPRRINIVAGVAGRAGHAGGAALAGVVTDPGALRMGLTNPALIRTLHAFHDVMLCTKGPRPRAARPGTLFPKQPSGGGRRATQKTLVRARGSLSGEQILGRLRHLHEGAAFVQHQPAALDGA